MNKEAYLKFVEEKQPKTKISKTMVASFLFGGLICTIGEVFRLMFLEFFSLNEKDAGSMVSVVLILITAILTGMGIFHKIASLAGAGSFVPITGFANSIISSALEFKTEGFVLGVGAKIFIIAGPVIVYGSIASIIYGLIFYMFNAFGGNL